jgi:hypothetical protein
VSDLLPRLDIFAPSLHQHLQDEIHSLLALSSLEPRVNLLQIWMKTGGKKTTEKREKEKLANELSAMLNHEVNFEDGRLEDFPPMASDVRVNL